MIRVVLVDNDQDFLQPFEQFLSFQPDIEVVGMANNGQEALDVVEMTHPDVVVMDIRMPVLDGVGATRCVRTLHPSCQVLLFTTWSDDEYVWEGIRAGALGYKYKDAGPPDVAAAIHAVADGELVVDQPAMKKMAKFMCIAPMPQQMPADHQLFTKGEYKILQLLAAGLSNQEIADRLGVVEQTVKTHVGNILDKLVLG